MDNINNFDQKELKSELIEMKKLYDCGKLRELNQIEFDDNEPVERRIAAHAIAKFGFDPRRF